ncbi:MAG TPA: hypothetical protein DEP88_04700 [Verrucomicrobiales bacterium]|nr:hypothetical protein [Verrucomicrobiales bacterium]HCI92551.1 hypothetical protein [Verrucomicrobiales bacterium]
MSHTLNFRRAAVSTLSLARVGNPLRSEPLHTSKELCRFSKEDAAVLTPSFLKPFKNLEAKQFVHHSSLDLNEVYRYTKTIFKEPDHLLDHGRKIARHLYNKSKHPNIKPGDLCIALVTELLVDGEPRQALSIIKSESKVPFLEVADTDGNLELIAHQGISPDKIDKGCLIIEQDAENGFLVYTFDKSSSGTHFWMRDFLAVKFRRDNDYMTRRYADMCVSFAKEGLPEEVGAEERTRIAGQAMGYFEDRDEFDLKHFRQEALKEPDVIEKFDQYREKQDDEDGGALEDNFVIAKKEARKAANRFRSTMKLDCGVNISFGPSFSDEGENAFERGFDEETGRKFVKIYYGEEL